MHNINYIVIQLVFCFFPKRICLPPAGPQKRGNPLRNWQSFPVGWVDAALESSLRLLAGALLLSHLTTVCYRLFVPVFNRMLF
jgi:hypothetical protein